MWGESNSLTFWKSFCRFLKSTPRNRSTNSEPDPTKQKHLRKPLGGPSESAFSFPFPKQLKQSLRNTIGCLCLPFGRFATNLASLLLGPTEQYPAFLPTPLFHYGDLQPPSKHQWHRLWSRALAKKWRIILKKEETFPCHWCDTSLQTVISYLRSK